MSNQIPSLLYRGASIAYIEGRNEWMVQLEGARIADKPSLVLARDAVDRFLDKETETKEKFKRREAWLVGWANKLSKVTVTGLCDDGKEAWVIDEKKVRSKVYLYNLRMGTTENQAKADDIARCEEKVEEIRNTITTLRDSMEKFTLTN